MGKVIDENTGQVPSCIFCNSEGDCSHLIAVIDRTFLECSGGELYGAIGGLRDKVSDLVTAKYLACDDFKEDSNDYELDALIQEAIEELDPIDPEDVYIYETMFLTWLIEALKDAGADEPWIDIVEEGGPGQSSAMTMLYAPDPKQVIYDVERHLNEKLERLKTARAKESHSEEIPPSPDEDPSTSETNKAPSTSETRRNCPGEGCRPVLIVVTDWPGGTMAMKFGSALKIALGATKEEMTLLQMSPERIFRVETKVSETNLRNYMSYASQRGIASGGTILFFEVQSI